MVSELLLRNNTIKGILKMETHNTYISQVRSLPVP
jgi:hypothetical protein